ncbi:MULTISPECIES: cell division protein FtsL [unclassified Paenibacillus]|uniref:cell division protein FtsL n=1 Tax=unclassified Paenibacillus TaxID=185978 RepID=UPI001AE5B6B9|nr:MULTISPECIES: cell division protein FtsL [unclassified Paenibacillus]MBP1156284.1 cell division protein FtsL [Paenibacillus sp. PvP091]MBP1168330.1 cell division protein FtsL [Paenibacillus sp. PvR098]MBP2439358.1 cell division protein FtsL [Paenibacillus sp. PvP052]
MPAYMHGNLATKQKTQPKVKIKETKKVIYRNKALPLQEKLLYLFTVLICVVVAGLIIWRYALIYEMNADIKSIEQKISKLEAENSILKQRVEGLSDPRRLEEEAKKLGYGVPADNQVKPSGTAKSGSSSASSQGIAANTKIPKDQP